jgi:TP901 family phage tail tape measure protein
MNEEELARLVVRLVGDTDSYQKMFTEAAAKADEMNRATQKLGAAEKETAAAIKLGAEVTKQASTASDKYSAEVKQVNALLAKEAISQSTANRTIKQARKAYMEAGNAATSYGKSMMSIGQAGLMRVTAPIVGIGIAAVAAGSSIESAFAGVRKTVDASEDELQGLKQEFEDFITQGGAPFDMTELLGAAETAGQLGIDFENTAGFATTVKNLELATNLGDSAGESLARIANITGLPQTQFENLGSTIVALGNNSAATESDIVDMTLRLGAAGRLVGMSVSETTALVGINAEAGGTAFSKLFIEMSRQVATGGKDLAAFAKTAGMSVAEFSDLFEKDAAGAVQALIGGLGKLDGTGAIQALDAMGISEQRMTDAILRSAGATDMMAKSMKLASKAFEENTALANEVKVRYESFGGIVKNTWAQLGLLGEEIFQTLRPALIAAMDAITKGIDAFRGMDDSTKGVIITVAALAAAIPPLLIAVSGIATAGGTLAIAYTTLTAASGGLAISTVALNAALAASPYAIIAIEVAALIGLIGALALAHADLNAELEKSGELNSQLIADTQKRAEAVAQESRDQFEAGNNAAAQTTLQLGLEDAESRLEGFRNQVKAAAKDVEANAWNIIDRGALKAARQELDDAVARMRAAQDVVKQFKGEMLGPNSAVGFNLEGSSTESAASAATAEAAVAGVPQDVLDGVEALDQKLQEQINTFGMTQQEVEIYKLKLAGATDETLKFVNAMSNGLDVMEKNRAFEDKMASIQQSIDSVGLTGVDLEIFNLANLGMGAEQLDKIRPKLEELQAKTESFKTGEKQKADADKLIEKFLPPEAKVEKQVRELQVLLDAELIDKGTFDLAVADAEKQLGGLTGKEHTVDLGVKGIDAVAAGSAEAMERVAEFMNSRSGSTRVSSQPIPANLMADLPAVDQMGVPALSGLELGQGMSGELQSTSSTYGDQFDKSEPESEYRDYIQKEPPGNSGNVQTLERIATAVELLITVTESRPIIELEGADFS